MSGLAAGFPLALVLSAARSLLASQSIGRRWFGGVGRVLLPTCQLPLQIRDLFFGLGELPIPISYLLTEFFNLTLLPLELPLKFFLTW
jgi:hypothetical protein